MMVVAKTPESVLAVRILLLFLSLVMGLFLGARHSESTEAATVVATGWFFILGAALILSWRLTPLVCGGFERWLDSFARRADELLSSRICSHCNEPVTSCDREPRRAFWTSLLSMNAKLSLTLVPAATSFLSMAVLLIVVSIGDIPHWVVGVDAALVVAAVWVSFSLFVAVGLASFIIWAEYRLWRGRKLPSRSSAVSTVKRAAVDHVKLPELGRVFAAVFGS